MILRAREFDAIKGWNIKFRSFLPGDDGVITSRTLNDLSEDLLDYHFDQKDILQRIERKLLKYRVKINRTPIAPFSSYFPSLAPSDYAGEDLGNGITHSGGASVDGSYIFYNVGGTPSGGFTPPNNTRWEIVYKLPDPDPVEHIEEGQFYTPPNYYTPPEEVMNELLEIDMLRMGYLWPLDQRNVTKRGNALKTNLLIKVEAVDGNGTFTDWIIETQASAPIRSNTSASMEVGDKLFQVDAGLSFAVGQEVEVRREAQRSQAMFGTVLAYNTDGHNTFVNPVAQGTMILHDGPIGYLFRTSESDLIVPIIRRFGGKTKDRIGYYLHPEGLDSFDRLTHIFTGSAIEGAPYWGDGAEPVLSLWTNRDHVPAAETTFVAFHELAVGSYSPVKFGYVERLRSGTGTEHLSLSFSNFEYVDP